MILVTKAGQVQSGNRALTPFILPTPAKSGYHSTYILKAFPNHETRSMNNQGIKQQAWLNSMSAGERSFNQGHFSDAARAFNQAAQLLPTRVESWINLGSALLEAGRFRASAAALKNAISISPNLMVSHMMMGDALRQLGLSAQSLASYQSAVSLQRTPMGLNKLACALRIEREMNKAEALYREAVRLEPNFMLARVNLATLHIEMAKFEEAATQLNALDQLPLSPTEKEEVAQSRLAIGEYFHLKEPLATLSKENNPVPLETALVDMPPGNRKVDEEVLKTIRLYAKAASDLPDFPSIMATNLPGEWPFIESMFTRGIVNTVDEYLEVRSREKDREKKTSALLESLNMEAVIQTARTARQDLVIPVKAELHLRHWHALACRDLAGYFPGHFKYTQNRTARNPTLKHVEPALASSTFRYLIKDLYTSLKPGLSRAAIVLIAVGHLHPFADGNGRIARNWLNRELEWAGLMPTLFPYEQGLKRELADAISIVHAGDGDLSPILTVITKAQNFAVAFCDELARS